MSEAAIAVLDRCDVIACIAVRGSDVLVSADSGGSVWCLDHLLDDWLPELTPGVLGGCVACGTMCITWTPDRQCLHERCRRAWASGKPPVAIEIAPEVRHGAYGRRARQA